MTLFSFSSFSRITVAAWPFYGPRAADLARRPYWSTHAYPQNYRKSPSGLNLYTKLHSAFLIGRPRKHRSGLLMRNRGGSEFPLFFSTCCGARIAVSVCITHAGTEGQASIWNSRIGPQLGQKKEALSVQCHFSVRTPVL